MFAIFSRVTFSAAILLASVLVHVGLFGVIVLADRQTLLQSDTQTIDVELLKPDEFPEPPEPPKLEPPKPEPPKPEPPKVEAPKPTEQQAAAAPLPPPPVTAPAASMTEPPQPEAKSAKAEPQAPPDMPEKPEKPSGISGGPPSESKSKLTPEEIAALRAQVQKCWKLPVGRPGVLGVEVVMGVSLGPKGQLIGEPVMRSVKAASSQSGPLIVGIAMNALKDCAPYRMPPAKYSDWKMLDLRFLATGMTGLGVAPKIPPVPQAKR